MAPGFVFYPAAASGSGHCPAVILVGYRLEFSANEES